MRAIAIVSFLAFLFSAGCSDEASKKSSRSVTQPPSVETVTPDHEIVTTPPVANEGKDATIEPSISDQGVSPDFGTDVSDAGEEPLQEDAAVEGDSGGVDAQSQQDVVELDASAAADEGTDFPDPDAEADMAPLPEHDAFVNPPPANPTCDVVEVEHGGRCFNGCDDDNDGILDSLDPSCEGSCDINNPFCPDGMVCDATSEQCEIPPPIEEQFPDPGVCTLLAEEHPCHDLCIVNPPPFGSICLWGDDGAIHYVKDEDGDLVPDEALVAGVAVDNCTAWYNPRQVDDDLNGVGDECDLPPEGQVDGDDDFIPDGLDNCPFLYNPWQADADGDGVGDECVGMPPEGCEDGDDRTQDQWNPQSLWCEHRAYESQWFFWTHLCGEDRTGPCATCVPSPVEGQTVVVYNGWACTVYPDVDLDGRPELGEGIAAQYLDAPFVDPD